MSIAGNRVGAGYTHINGGSLILSSARVDGRSTSFAFARVSPLSPLSLVEGALLTFLSRFRLKESQLAHIPSPFRSARRTQVAVQSHLLKRAGKLCARSISVPTHEAARGINPVRLL